MENEVRISLRDIEGMSKIPRLTLVNALSGFKSANLIGTVSEEGVNNLAIFSSVVHLGSNPPFFGFITRPTVVPRHTYSNIKSTGQFTINHIHSGITQQAHQTSAKYDHGISEFETCGFTPVFKEGIKAPFVKESRIQMGLSYVEEYEIKANGTLMIVGKLEELFLPDQVIQEDGYLDLSLLNTVCIGGLESYYKVEQIARYGYARV